MASRFTPTNNATPSAPQTISTASAREDIATGRAETPEAVAGGKYSIAASSVSSIGAVSIGGPPISRALFKSAGSVTNPPREM